MPEQPIIGLVGGIGAGKSALSDVLESLGCVVSDSDACAREALQDAAIRRTLIKWWGDSIVNGDAGIDRRAVAAIVFNDPEERKRLERLTHPWIETRRRATFASAPASAPALVIDAPLLMEVGLDEECDAVIFVEASPEVRLARVRVERSWDDAEVRKREDSQLPLDEKKKRADYVVRNEGDLSELESQIRPILDDIVAAHRA